MDSLIINIKRFFTVLLIVHSPFSLAADDFEFSGFARVIGGYLDESHATFKGYDDRLKFKPSSLLGLQLDYTPIEQLSITGQVIARAQDSDINLEWLYLNYRPSAAVQIKAGKLRTPFFSLSDYTEVGYAYPWISPPQQVYNAYLFRTFEGVDATYFFSGGSFDASVEVYLGQHDGTSSLGGAGQSNNLDQVDFSVRNMAGIIGKLNVNHFEVRASRYGGDVKIDVPAANTLATMLSSFGFTDSASSLNTDGNVTVSQLGLSYENLSYFARSEWVKIESETELAPKIESYYVTFGYKFPSITFHITYGDSQAIPSNPSTEIQEFLEIPAEALTLDQQQLQLGANLLAAGYTQLFDSLSRDDLQSWTIGTRWDFKKDMALKFEYSMLKGKQGQASFFSDIDDVDFDRQANLYQIGLEWIF